MSETLRLLFCEYYRPEIEFLKAEGELGGVSFSFFNGMCGCPSLRWDQLEEAAGVVAKPERLKILGGCCLGISEPMPVGLSAAKLTRFNSCLELIAEETQIADLRPEVYALTLGWLGAWQETMAVWGFDKAAARDFFAESSNSILLLDTGKHPESLNRLKAFSDFVDLPCRVVDIGISTFRARLRSIVEDVNSTSESLHSEGV